MGLLWPSLLFHICIYRPLKFDRLLISYLINLFLDSYHQTPIWYTAFTIHHKDQYHTVPDSKGHGANMGPIWGQQDPGGSHVGPMNFVTWDVFFFYHCMVCPISSILHNLLDNTICCWLNYHHDILNDLVCYAGWMVIFSRPDVSQQTQRRF